MKALTILGSLVAVALVFSTVIAAEKEKKEAKEKKVKVVCPVSKREIDKEAFVAYKDAKLFFCCQNCPKAFAKSPEKFASKANLQLVATKQAKQAMCPFTGRKLNKEATIKVAGVKVAFCCNNCKGKAEKTEKDKQVDLVFNDKSFVKGFKVKKPKKKAA